MQNIIFTMSKRLLYLFIFLLSFLLFFLLLSANNQNLVEKTFATEKTKPKQQIDFTQADLMLAFLEGLQKGKLNAEEVENIIEAKGTDLIIKLMNFARKVTKDQYRQILLNLDKNSFPEIRPVDLSERAKRGVMGLKKDAWPALRWGIGHTDTLEINLSSFRDLDIYEAAKTLALKNLPVPVDLSPSLFVVMGGREGFAALEGENIL